MNTLPTSVRDYLKEIFDAPSKLKAITLCRNGILHQNAGKRKYISLVFTDFMVFILDNNGIVGYQTLLQYFLRNLDGPLNQSFLDEVDEVKIDSLLYQ